MNILLIYDISEDSLRRKAAELCKDYGLVRIQYSAFFGRLSRNLCGEMKRRMTELLKDSCRSSVIILPLHQESLDKIIKLDFNYYDEGMI